MSLPTLDTYYLSRHRLRRKRFMAPVCRRSSAPPYARRTIMLVLLNVFQAIGFFGFNNWVPALMQSEGTSFVKSLQYSFFIATLFPIASLSCVSS